MRADYHSDPIILPVGLLVISPCALELLALYDTRAVDLLAQHIRGHWPDMTREECEANIQRAGTGRRVDGRYRLPGPPQADVIVVTEPVCSVTYVLLPKEAQALVNLVPAGIERRSPDGGVQSRCHGWEHPYWRNRRLK